MGRDAHVLPVPEVLRLVKRMEGQEARHTPAATPSCMRVLAPVRASIAPPGSGVVKGTSDTVRPPRNTQSTRWPPGSGDRQKSVETLWKPCGNPVETPWKPCGNPVETLWKPRGNPVEIPWKPCGNPVETLWIPCGNPVEILWKPHGNPVETMWKPCGNPVETLRCANPRRSRTLLRSVRQPSTGARATIGAEGGAAPERPQRPPPQPTRRERIMMAGFNKGAPIDPKLSGDESPRSPASGSANRQCPGDTRG